MKKILSRRLAGIVGTLLLAAGVLNSACTDDSWDFSQRTEPVTPITAVYMEVNDVNPLNTLCYEMNGKPFFNYVILFAANINGTSEGRAELGYKGGKLERALNETVKPLQAKGVKVLLSILGNHTGLGFANLTDEQVEDFANQIKTVVDTYNLDGVDFDDEYAEYGSNGFMPANTASYANLISAVRSKLGSGKLITIYDVDTGNSKTLTAVRECVDWAWSEQYNLLKGRCKFGLGNRQYCGFSQRLDKPFAISDLYTVNNALQSFREGYMGALLFYNLRKTPEKFTIPGQYAWSPPEEYTVTTDDVRQILSRTTEKIFAAPVEVTVSDDDFYDWD